MTTKAQQSPTPGDLQRWSEELARNPASLAFLPLARAYRRQGRLDLGLKLCLRGLEHHPEHVEAHALLALLYLESGDRARAADEWAVVLRLKPGNFEALRGMGFRYLEEGDIAKARQHLERAALIRPRDTVVQEALRLLRSRQEKAMAISEPHQPPVEQTAPVTAPPQVEGEEPEEAVDILDLTEPVEAGAAFEWADQEQTQRVEAGAGPTVRQQSAPTQTSAAGIDPMNPFGAILGETPALGALLLDVRGLVLAGRLGGDASARADDIGALVGGAVEEAARATDHLGLGGWKAMRIEADSATVQVTPAADDSLVLIAAKRGTPLGWLRRSAGSATAIAKDFLGGGNG